MRIVVLDGYALNPGDISWSAIEALGELTVHDRTPPGEVVARAAGAAALFTNKTPITAADLAALPALRFIGVLATGYNVVDTAAARAQGVAVCNVPTYGTMSVAQYATALLLELCHQVGRHAADVKAGGWQRQPDFSYWLCPLVELDGKTLGLIGVGRIGQAFARIAQAMGMRVLAHDPKPDRRLEESGLRFVGLDELYAEADVISLHCPLFETNRGMINRGSIAKMRPGALLLNTSRGPLVVEADLADALNSGRLGGAALDVLAEEPPRADNPLLTARNCIVTPHIAWAAQAPRQRIMDTSAENLARFLAGTPQNLVNG